MLTFHMYFSTDSVSLFGDMEHEGLEEADESEETVLMSLKGKPLIPLDYLLVFIIQSRLLSRMQTLCQNIKIRAISYCKQLSLNIFFRPSIVLVIICCYEN